ncbi:MAG: DnaJ family domain-containing protein [Dehalobacterium sp.]
MDIISKLAEEKIREAMANGEFNNLSGQGKPLKIEDLSCIPEELRSGYIILKNSGILPEELDLKKEIISLKELINCCCDEEEITLLKQKLTEKTLRFDILMEKRNRNIALNKYKARIYDKFK